MEANARMSQSRATFDAAIQDAEELYVEDRVREALAARIASEGEGPCARFIQRRLDEELKKFNNPNTEKTRRLFMDFLEVDVTASWVWNQYDVTKVKTTLDTLIAKRGEAVHRSSPKRGGPPAPHLVTKDELKKAINFLKSLVEATERAL